MGVVRDSYGHVGTNLIFPRSFLNSVRRSGANFAEGLGTSSVQYICLFPTTSRYEYITVVVMVSGYYVA